jgi:hypothetical protein
MAPPATPEDVRRRIAATVGAAQPKDIVANLGLEDVILLSPEEEYRDEYTKAQTMVLMDTVGSCGLSLTSQMLTHFSTLQRLLALENFGALAPSSITREAREARLRKACAKAWSEFRELRRIVAAVDWDLDRHVFKYEKKKALKKKEEWVPLVSALKKAVDRVNRLLLAFGPDDELEWTI